MKAIRISLRQMQMFVVLAEVGSFRGAARQLNISQSALSIAIGRMEETLGVTLFDRTTRNVELTQIGRDFLGPTRRILTDIDHTLNDVQAVAHGKRGTVTVACTYSVATRVVPEVLVNFRQEFPGVNVVILDNTTRVIIGTLIRGEADIGVCGQVELDDSLEFEPVLEDRFEAVVPEGHVLAKRSQVSWSALADHAFVAMAPGTQMRDQIDRVFDAQGLKVRPVVEAWHYSALTKVVSLGLGVTALPALIANDGRDQLIRRRLVSPSISRVIGVVTPRRRSLAPAARFFKDRLIQALRRQRIGTSK